MTLTQAAQLAVVVNASISLAVTIPALIRAVAQLGKRLRRALRRNRQGRTLPEPAKVREAL